MSKLRPMGLVVGALGVVVAFAACSGDDGGGAGGGDEDGGVLPAAAAPELASLDGEVPFDEPVTLRVENGSVVSAEVVDDAGTTLAGAAGEAGWTSESPPLPGATYDVTIEATADDGEPHTVTGAFTVAEVPDDRRLTLNVIRGGGETVGVGTPIIVRFEQEVANRAAVEAALHVSSEPQVTGAWHWLSSQEVHFRPEGFWPANTQIRADLELNGVQAGEDLWGGRSYSYDIGVGDERRAVVDAEALTFTLIKNGEAVESWPTSLGSLDFATRNGIYVVLSKDRDRTMTSCNANITCDEDDDDWYEVDTEFAVRLTNSGTFVHAADWSAQAQGEENVSHGCLNLTTERAEIYYEQARYGDVVEVVNSTREADDLVERGDPGMADWNLTWSELLTRSELGAFTTSSL